MESIPTAIGVTRSPPKKRAAIAFVYVVVLMPAMIGFTSLAVDFGRVQVAKTELRRACDAAALYGSAGISDGTAVAKAIQAARENSVDGSSLTLTASDIATGSWVSGIFTANGTPVNAIRIITGRTAARGNAIPLLFATVVGKPTCDVNATVVVYRPFSSTSSGYGFFGTGNVSLSGSVSFDAYNSAVNSYSASTAENKASIAANGNITANNTTVGGSLQAGVGKCLGQSGSTSISGSTTNLTSTPTFTTPTLPSSYNAIGTIALSGTQTFYLGVAGQTTTYYATGVSLSGNITLNIAGPVVLYNSGTFATSGTFNVITPSPSNFTIEQMNSSSVTLNATGTTAAHIYAPASPITLNTSADYYGSILSASLSISGGAHLHDDETSSASGKPSMVK